MSVQITTAFVEQFTSGIDLLVQQRGSRLRNAVRLETGIVGTQASFDRIGSTAAQKRTTRHTDTPLISTPHDRRWVTMGDYEWADLIDDADKLKVLNDPTNDYSQNAAYAMGRAIDDEIIAAFKATASTGVDGTGTAPWSSGQTIVHGSAGLTVSKLRDAKQLLDEAENDEEEERFLVCSAEQIKNLLGETEVTSSDFNTVRALVNGEVNEFMGFRFIRSERLPKSSTTRSCFAWPRSGMLLALAKDSTGRISERADKSYSTQVYYSMSIGSVRMQEVAVVEIQATETA